MYFWALYSVPLTYVSVFVPVPCCFDACSLVVWFKIREQDAFLVALLGIVQFAW